MSPIEAMVRQRRAALGERFFPAGAKDVWGLALSGGGIRSATFSFGLLRALAHRKLLLRFDLLSTVSGGGYIGSTLGRLFSRATSPQEVRAVAAAMGDASGRWFMWWLRANGRYLIPRGTRDRIFALALYVRNLIGVHVETGIVCALLGIVLALIDIGGWETLDQLAYGYPQWVFPAARYLPQWLPVIAFAEPFIVLAGAVLTIAYWCVPWLMRDKAIGRGIVSPWIGSAALAAIGWHWRAWIDVVNTDVGSTSRLLLMGAALFLFVTWFAALPVAWLAGRRAAAIPSPTLRADAMRTTLTQWLAVCVQVALAVALIGAVDRTAWFIAFEAQTPGKVGLGLGAVAAAVRAMLPTSSQLDPGRLSTRALLALGRLFGYGLTFALCSWWISIVYRAGLGAAFQPTGPDFVASVRVLIELLIPVGGYMVVTGSNLAFLNLSSMHGFYRARLVRSYLGAGNGRRFKKAGPLGAISPLPTPMPAVPTQVAIEDSEPDDDVSFLDYKPFAFGGPVHLINVCINQTHDPRGGLFNQDRRGLPLSVASGGQLRVGQEDWQAIRDPNMTLGTWAAISGAAVAPGLGNLTRGGISALATFAGIRLGYWWDAAARRGARSPAFAIAAKSAGLLRETFGEFSGGSDDSWFLSDGGHFENTGAYALLAERARVIVLADCGADPDYDFKDLENLVRKARIDLHAEIVMQKPKHRPDPDEAGGSTVQKILRALLGPTTPARPHQETLAIFGSLNDLASPTSKACLAMARIEYSGERSGTGILILIKPNVSDEPLRPEQ